MRSSGCCCPCELSKAATSKRNNGIAPKVSFQFSIRESTQRNLMIETADVFNGVRAILASV